MSDGAPRRARPRARWIWLGGALAALVAVVYAAAFMIDEPLRRSIESRMNASLKGYTVRIGAADFHPFGFSLDVIDLVVRQDANPEPPVMRIGRLGASVHWRALLHARLVGDAVIEHPSVHLNLRHLAREAQEAVPVRERGWQDALQAVYPLKINQLRVVDGEVTYVDGGPTRPLRLTALEATAENIQNVRSRERTYPSVLRLETAVFDTGRLVVDGRADFLAEPFPGITGQFTLDQMRIDYFDPVARRYGLSLREGVLRAAGGFEYAPTAKTAVLSEVTLRGARLEYTHTARTVPAERTAARVTARTARDVADRPDLTLAIDRLDVVDSTVAFANEAGARPYRVFFTHADLHVEGLSNQSAHGHGRVMFQGRFMGSGHTEAVARLRPDRRGGDIDLKMSIENTDLVAMNDLLRAHAGLDVAAGRFSVYSDLTVRNGALRGYVKPLFKDVVAYDPRQDSGRSFGERLKERVVGGLARLLANRSRGEVATRVDFSGRLDDPRTSSNWRTAGRLIQNAFFKAILPGFERPRAPGREAPRGGRGDKPL